MPPAPERRRTSLLFSDPDVELYDSTGRTTEQIHAYNINAPTRHDRRRWAVNDARPLLDAARLPPSGDGITPWTDLLGQARKAHEVYAVIAAVLADDYGALARLHQFIEAAANWHDERGDEQTKRSYRGLADDLDALANDLLQVAEDTLLTARWQRHDPGRQPPVSARPGTSPVPPTPPPSAPRR